MAPAVMPAIENALGQLYSKSYRAWLLSVLMAMNALNLGRVSFAKTAVLGAHSSPGVRES